MVFEVNRGKVILKNWDQRQRELGAIGEVEGDLTRGVKREKYIFLRDGLARLSTDATIDERIYAGMIRAILEKLRKDFFPSPILRKYMTWKERLLIMPGLIKYFKEKRLQNFEQLDRRVNSMGITGLTEHLKSQLDFEREKIELPISSRFEQNGALELTLVFQKRSREYRLGAMEATLLATGGYDRKCSIPERYGLHVNHSIYLLKGGAVRLEHVAGDQSEIWLQLDFDHRDENGRFPLREHVLDERLSLDKILSETARELAYPAINKSEVLDIIKTGAQAVFKPENMEAFYLEANPRDRGLLFRDENQRVIPLYDLKESLGERTHLSTDQHLTIKKLDTSNSAEKNKGISL